MRRSVTTTTSSISVKPRSVISRFTTLPVLVFRAVKRFAFERRVNVEHVLSAPSRRIGLVLVRAHAPLVATCHGVDRNAPQELQFPPRGIIGGSHPIHQRLQVGRIVLAADLDVERSDLPD